MNKASISLIIGIFLAVANTGAHAFDGKRKGFQIGAGIGTHSSDLSYKTSFAPDSIDSDKKVAVSLLLGYGFSNRIVGYVGGKGGSISINDVNASFAVAGIGGSFYLNELSPSLYLTGLVGGASLEIDGETENMSDSGDGWLVGVGYEITDRLHLELSHAQADLTDPINTTDTSKLTSSFLTLQYTLY